MAECNVHIIKEDKFWGSFLKHFCNRKKSCSFLEEWDEEVFLILGEVGTVPKWDKNPERTQCGPIWAIAGL